MMNNVKRLALVLGASLSLVGCSVSPVIYNHVQEAWTSANVSASYSGDGVDFWRSLASDVSSILSTTSLQGNYFYAQTFDAAYGSVLFWNNTTNDLYFSGSSSSLSTHYLMNLITIGNDGAPVWGWYDVVDGRVFSQLRPYCFMYAYANFQSSYVEYGFKNSDCGLYYDSVVSFSFDATSQSDYIDLSLESGNVTTWSATSSYSDGSFFLEVDFHELQATPRFNLGSVGSSAYSDGYGDGYSTGFSDGYSSGYIGAIQQGEAGIEVIDMWSLFSTIITMPFTFVQQGFNFTIFAGTSYEFNAGMFLGSVLVILMIWKILQLVFKFGK